MRMLLFIVMKLLGLLLLAAAVLKGMQLLSRPVLDSGIWTSRWFMILAVEFEILMGVWLLSGLYKKVAWLAAILCFVFFSGMSLYRAVIGAESCGCFGDVEVNPWVTLFAIDLPAVILLAVARPRPAGRWFGPAPSLARIGGVGVFLTVSLITSTGVLALNEPAKVTDTYEVLELQEWVGGEMPIMKHIDIKETLEKGEWFILFYHHDCHTCRDVIPKYLAMARELRGNPKNLRVAFVEIPPYGPLGIEDDFSPVILGKLADVKEWLLMTPAGVLLKSGKVQRVIMSNKL